MNEENIWKIRYEKIITILREQKQGSIQIWLDKFDTDKDFDLNESWIDQIDKIHIRNNKNL